MVTAAASNPWDPGTASPSEGARLPSHPLAGDGPPGGDPEALGVEFIVVLRFIGGQE